MVETGTPIADERATADPSEGGPPPRQARQNDNGKRSHQERSGQHHPPPNRVEHVARQSRRSPYLRTDPGKRQAQKLPPQGTSRRADVTANVELFCRAAADLAARCLRNGARWREHNLVWWRSGDVSRDLLRACLQCCAPRRIGLARLGENDDALGAGGCDRSRQRPRRRPCGFRECRPRPLRSPGDIDDGPRE